MWEITRILTKKKGIRIAVASGKGGTGKTTIAVNLARVLASNVWLLDCDVEEPNVHLFLRGDAHGEKIVTIPVPQVDEFLCDGCGECGRFCEYHAIISFGTTPLIFSEMCHGCGGCAKVCPRNAIHEVDQRIGIVKTMQAENITLIQGRLDVGIAMATPLIRALEGHLRLAYHDASLLGTGVNGALAILDAPPGTSCPVIVTLRASDFVVLVTEPTPFGLHDLTLAVAMVRELRIPFGVVINRVGIGDDRVHEFCGQEDIPIFLEIPDDRQIAVTYSRGELIVDALPEYRAYFERLGETLLEWTAIDFQNDIRIATSNPSTFQRS